MDRSRSGTYCKVITPKNRPALYLMVEWKVHTCDFRITDGCSVWIAYGVNGETHKAGLDSWLDNTFNALCCPSPSTQFQFLANDVGRDLELKWQWPRNEGTLGNAKWTATRSAKELDDLRAILYTLCESFALLKAAVDNLCTQKDDVQNSLGVARSKLREEVEGRQTREEELFSKLAVLLNDKKRKLRELTAALQLQEERNAQLQQQIEAGGIVQGGHDVASDTEDDAGSRGSGSGSEDEERLGCSVGRADSDADGRQGTPALAGQGAADTYTLDTDEDEEDTNMNGREAGGLHVLQQRACAATAPASTCRQGVSRPTSATGVAELLAPPAPSVMQQTTDGPAAADGHTAPAEQAGSHTPVVPRASLGGVRGLLQAVLSPLGEHHETSLPRSGGAEQEHAHAKQEDGTATQPLPVSWQPPPLRPGQASLTALPTPATSTVVQPGPHVHMDGALAVVGTAAATEAAASDPLGLAALANMGPASSCAFMKGPRKRARR